ncbi:MAG: hypothetical protein PHT51_03245 [Patescibacteria group bacterium]|nr:hypothetical protein [Patescibacteria group bacterium]MDD4610995.1 hypothetical protein [Patescibacteria group bacterium]
MRSAKEKNKETTKQFFGFIFFCFSNRKGMAALLIVVIVSAALLIIAYSAIYLGLGDLEMGYDSQKGEEALSVADGCMEEALHRLSKNNSYSGAALTFDNGTCVIAVTNTGGANRTIDVASTAGLYSKKIEATVSISGAPSTIISINSWQELSN